MKKSTIFKPEQIYHLATGTDASVSKEEGPLNTLLQEEQN